MSYYNRFVMRVVFSILFPLIFYPIKSLSVIPSPDDKNDFSVIINQRYVVLGETWSDLKEKQLGEQTREGFVGDIPFGDNSFKFYQHAYEGFEIYTSNIFWGREHRDVDSYIIAQITLNGDKIKTARGIKVGDKESDVIHKYGNGTVDNSDDQFWIYYVVDGKRLSFQIEHEKVSHIMMVFNDDN